SAVHCLSLVGLIAAKRIQVVHTNNSIEAAVAGIITGRPVVFHLHGTFSEALPSRLRWVFRRCAVVVAISAYVRDSAASAGIDAARIETVPTGTQLQATTSTRASEIRLRLGVPPDAPLVALVGRIVPWKGHREFLLAAIEVYKTHPNAHFVLVGGVSDG